MRNKRIISLVAAGLLVLFSSAGVYAEGTNEKVLDARESVVRILNVPQMGEGSIGSGFAVGKKGEDPQYFVTNDHCVRGSAQGTSDIFLILDSLENESSIISVEVIYQTDGQGKDIAVLKTAEPVKERVPAVLGTVENAHETDTVYALGYPGDTDVFTQSQGTLESAIEDCTVKTGHITRMNGGEYQGARFMVFEGQIKPGNSGGPLMNEDAQVIGVNSIKSSIQEAVDNGAIYIDEVKEILDENNIAYMDASSKAAIGKKAGRGIGLATGLLVGAGVLLLTAGTLAGRIRKRKRLRAARREAELEGLFSDTDLDKDIDDIKYM